MTIATKRCTLHWPARAGTTISRYKSIIISKFHLIHDVAVASRRFIGSHLLHHKAEARTVRADAVAVKEALNVKSRNMGAHARTIRKEARPNIQEHSPKFANRCAQALNVELDQAALKPTTSRVEWGGVLRAYPYI